MKYRYIYTHLYIYIITYVAFFVYYINKRDSLSISRGRVTMMKESRLCLSVSLFLCLSVSHSLIGYMDEGEQAADRCFIAALCGLEQLRPTAFLFLRRLRSCVGIRMHVRVCEMRA